jgi:hypothetical protein
VSIIVVNPFHLAQDVGQTVADKLVAAIKDIADLKAALEAAAPDREAMKALAASVEGTLAAIANELPPPNNPEPVPVPNDDPAAT